MTNQALLLLELEQKLNGRVDARKVLGLLQKLSSVDTSFNSADLQVVLAKLWNHDLLLDDCILVSGILFVRSRLAQQQEPIQEILNHSVEQYKQADWIRLGILRGLLVVCKSSLLTFLPDLLQMTETEIQSAIQANRLILVARHLENLLQILELNYNNGILPAAFSQAICLTLSKTLLLKSDLVEYKSRDVIKFQYQKLDSSDAERFLFDTLELLPEIGKVALHCFDSALQEERGISKALASVIFEHSLPLIKVKGMGQSAAKCVAKSLKLLEVADSLLARLFQELALLSGSKEKIAFTKILFSELDSETRSAFKTRLQANSPSGLLFLEAAEGAITILNDSDEYYSFEAFSVLVRRRKPVDAIDPQDLALFKDYLQAVSFSASVELRQKVWASSKALYDQIFGRLYHLIRETHKNRAVDMEATGREIDAILDYLLDIFLSVFIEPYDFVRSNFCSLEFVLKQILLVLGSFEGNVTLAGANSQFMSEAQVLFRDRVISMSLLKHSDKFMNCIGYSTYDSLRLLCSDILCKCQIRAEAIDLDPFFSLLGHPRAINNEGAARMIQIYSRLQSSDFGMISRINEQVNQAFSNLTQNFPYSLMQNNVNGRLLALRFLLSDSKSDAIQQVFLETVINRTIEMSCFVSIVASHPSPEGLDLDLDLDEQVEGGDFDDELALPTSQYVLSFAWRAIKESTLLLEAIVCKYVHLLSPGILDKIAKHFIHLLLTLRHRGAFSSVEGPLSSVLKHGFAFPEIKQRLSEILQVALETEEISSTRRSAGLPHLILAVVHSCSKSCEIDELLALLIPRLIEKSEESPSLIHAFNITRSLIRDSKLAPELSRHIGAVALMCLHTFNSTSWSVRNASSMLLSSLISRVFGSAHLNQSEADSIDLRELEVKFYGLLAVIESFMSEALSKSIESRLAYPLLAVLERSKIPVNERFDSFRALVLDFLLKLIADLGEGMGGGKLIHVVSRVFCGLLNNRSLVLHEARLLESINWTQANSVYNYLILFEALHAAKAIDEQILGSFLGLAGQACQSNWNSRIQARLQALSHNYQPSLDNATEKTVLTPVERYSIKKIFSFGK